MSAAPRAAINDSGQIVRWYLPGYHAHHGFLLSGGVYTTFDVPNSEFTEVYGINDSGQIVGAHDTGPTMNSGFLLSGDIFTTFDVPGSHSTFPYGINASGQIVGYYEYYVDAAGISLQGFLATPGP
jgi:uncharacterized membrane protein